MDMRGSRLTLIKKYPKYKKNMKKEMYRSNMEKYMLDISSQPELDSIHWDRSKNRSEVPE